MSPATSKRPWHWCGSPTTPREPGSPSRRTGGEAPMHLAGFLVNGNPGKSPQTTFIVVGFGSTQSTAALQPGRHNWTYVRVARWDGDGDTAYCDAFVFDAETSRLVMQCRDLRYQELPRATWRHILKVQRRRKKKEKGTPLQACSMPSFRSRVPVYGIDSPFLHCPDRMINGRVGLEGVVKLIVDALTKAQPTGPMWIGGFLAGSLVGYEVARQLAAAGRRAQGLLLIDMCSPRAPQGQDGGGSSSNLSAEGDFSFGVFEADDARVMRMLRDQGIATTAYPGYMEDPALGTFATLVPDKTPTPAPTAGTATRTIHVSCSSTSFAVFQRFI
ncbi:hypothetical protein PG988_005442 [Apiospora saccharicola]